MSPDSSVFYIEVTVYINSSVHQQQLQNKTLFNSCERLVLGTFNLKPKTGDRSLRSEHKIWPYPLPNGELT